MEGRNASESRARMWAEEARQVELKSEAESFELTRLAHNDVSNYKKQMAKEEQMGNEDGFDAKQRLEEQRMDQGGGGEGGEVKEEAGGGNDENRG